MPDDLFKKLPIFGSLVKFGSGKVQQLCPVLQCPNSIFTSVTLWVEGLRSRCPTQAVKKICRSLKKCHFQNFFIFRKKRNFFGNFEPFSGLLHCFWNGCCCKLGSRHWRYSLTKSYWEKHYRIIIRGFVICCMLVRIIVLLKYLKNTRKKHSSYYRNGFEV